MASEERQPPPTDPTLVQVVTENYFCLRTRLPFGNEILIGGGGTSRESPAGAAVMAASAGLMAFRASETKTGQTFTFIDFEVR